MNHINNRERVLNCLACDGYRHPCDSYQSYTQDEQCTWYKVIDNDIRKIRKGEPELTFPDLGEIIKLSGR